MEPPVDVEIRPLVREDWPVVAGIFDEGLRTGNATLETSVPSWDEWNASHLAEPRLIALVDAEIVGWAALAPASPRPVYAGVAEDSIYVAARGRGHGVGQVLLKRLVADAERQGIWTVQAAMFRENEASIALHRACGFRIVGIRERLGKLDGVWRDVVLLERRSPLVT